MSHLVISTSFYTQIHYETLNLKILNHENKYQLVIGFWCGKHNFHPWMKS